LKDFSENNSHFEGIFGYTSSAEFFSALLEYPQPCQDLWCSPQNNDTSDRKCLTIKYETHDRADIRKIKKYYTVLRIYHYTAIFYTAYIPFWRDTS